jgi:uncharacterized protein YkwD
MVCAILLNAHTLESGIPASRPMAASETAQIRRTAEEWFRSAVNRERASKGRRRLRWDSRLLRGARRAAFILAADATIYHDAGGIVSGYPISWRPVGENVGMGPTEGNDGAGSQEGHHVVDAGFRASAGHYANILDADYRRYAVAVIQVGDTIYVVQHFAHGVTPRASRGC